MSQYASLGVTVSPVVADGFVGLLEGFEYDASDRLARTDNTAPSICRGGCRGCGRCQTSPNRKKAAPRKSKTAPKPTKTKQKNPKRTNAGKSGRSRA